MEFKRIVIYPKDIERITGKSNRYARMILKQIRNKLNKEKHQMVSIHELCEYLGIKEQDIFKTQ